MMYEISQVIGLTKKEPYFILPLYEIKYLAMNLTKARDYTFNKR